MAPGTRTPSQPPSLRENKKIAFSVFHIQCKVFLKKGFNFYFLSTP